MRRTTSPGAVGRLAEAFAADRATVHEDLEAAFELRTKQNRRRWLRRVPAMLYGLYRYAVRRCVANWPVWLWLHGCHVGYGAERVRESIRLTPQPTASPLRPKASIVVLSYNRLAYLRTTLESLYATTEKDDFELIVVDNGSTDGSAEALRGLAASGVIDKLILRSRNHGTSAGFNVGFAYAEPSTQFLIKLDSDIKLLTPGWLPRFEAFFQRVPEAGILAMHQVNHAALMAAPRDVVGGENVISWNWWTVGSACMTIPRQVFQRLGYFCEDFEIKYMPDDVDYVKRVFLLGRKAYYPCRTRAYHRFDLDRAYERLQQQKRRELPDSEKKQKDIYREYVTGVRDIAVFYPHYQDCVFSAGQKIVEMD